MCVCVLSCSRHAPPRCYRTIVHSGSMLPVQPARHAVGGTWDNPGHDGRKLWHILARVTSTHSMVCSAQSAARGLRPPCARTKESPRHTHPHHRSAVKFTRHWGGGGVPPLRGIMYYTILPSDIVVKRYHRSTAIATQIARKPRNSNFR